MSKIKDSMTDDQFHKIEEQSVVGDMHSAQSQREYEDACCKELDKAGVYDVKQTELLTEFDEQAKLPDDYFLATQD